MRRRNNKSAGRDLLIVVGVITLTILAYVFKSDLDRLITKRRSDDRTWAKENLAISRSDAKTHIHVRMSPNLDDFSREALLSRKILQYGLEERLSYEAGTPIQLKLVGKEDDSVLFAVERPTSDTATVPELKRPNCSMHAINNGMLQDDKEMRFATEPDIQAVHARQARTLSDLKEPSEYVKAPAMIGPQKNEPRGEFLQRLAALRKSDQKNSNWFTNPKTWIEPQGMGLGPAHILFGSRKMDKEPGSMSENVASVKLNVHTRTSVFGEERNHMALEVQASTEEGRTFAKWTEDNSGESVAVLCNGWVLSQAPVFGRIDEDVPITFLSSSTHAQSNFIVSMLHSIGVINVEVLR